MGDKLENSGFARLYLWAATAKYTMGIFFMLFVFLYLSLGFIIKGSTVKLDLFTAMQMVCVCLAIGLLRQGIAPNNKMTKPRCFLWIALSGTLTLAASLIFGWFSPFPPWCFIVFLVIAVVGMPAALLGHFFELRRETQLLNRQLEKFQRRQTREE